MECCEHTQTIDGGNFETRNRPKHVKQEESFKISKFVPIEWFGGIE